MERPFATQIQARDAAPAFPGAGGDHLTLRLDADAGDCPVAVVEGLSQDREWAPFHSHPWDELSYVLEGDR